MKRQAGVVGGLGRQEPSGVGEYPGVKFHEGRQTQGREKRKQK